MVMRTMEFGEGCPCGFSDRTTVAMFGTSGGSGFAYWGSEVGGYLGFVNRHFGDSELVLGYKVQV